MQEEYTLLDMSLGEDAGVLEALAEFGEFDGTEADLTYEVCAHCECEVLIPNNAVSICPGVDKYDRKCQHHIRPCGDCLSKDKYPVCNWEANGRCDRFPDFRYPFYDDNGEVLRQEIRTHNDTAYGPVRCSNGMVYK